MHLTRTSSEDSDFQHLVGQLDAFLAEINGADHAFYNQFNAILALQHVVVAYAEGQAVGCGAFKPHGDGTTEIKRMFVDPAQRGRGIAQAVLADLEAWSRELGFQTCVLETSVKLPTAVQLCTQSGYERIVNYGQYLDVPDSVCFQKKL